MWRRLPVTNHDSYKSFTNMKLFAAQAKFYRLLNSPSLMSTLHSPPSPSLPHFSPSKHFFCLHGETWVLTSNKMATSIVCRLAKQNIGYFGRYAYRIPTCYHTETLLSVVGKKGKDLEIVKEGETVSQFNE